MDTFAVVDYPAVDIQLDRTWSGADRKRRTNGWTSQAAGVYPGLDRFGRVISQSWLDGVTHHEWPLPKLVQLGLPTKVP